MEFLIGNPFTTAVGQRIEQATSSSLQSEDWALNMEICDIVNTADEGPKDAVRAIKKRIVGNKNFREVMLALTVLEVCVKNCGHRFHILVSTREFVESVLVRTIIPKSNPPMILHDRVLSIIQAWADAFRSSPDLTGVVSVYEDLRRKGLEFPMTEMGSCSPIHTPNSNTNQVKKLKADLGVVQSNLNIMSEMMSQLDPVTAKHTDIELLQQLYTVCKDMQERIVELVPRISEEKLVHELLAANDEMNTTFTRYQRFERKITNGDSTAQKSHSYVNLIDLNLTTNDVSPLGAPVPLPNRYVNQSTIDALSHQMMKLSNSETDQLDTVAQKTSFSQNQQSEQKEGAVAEAMNNRIEGSGTVGSPGTDHRSSPQLKWMIDKGMIPLSPYSVMDDIEKWLDMNDEDDDFADLDGVTSEEFNQFLAKRAKAAEQLPSINSSSSDTNLSQTDTIFSQSDTNHAQP